MTNKRVYGHSKRGEPITDEMIEGFAEEAASGYEPGQLKGCRRGPGRPPLGDVASRSSPCGWSPIFVTRWPGALRVKASPSRSSSSERFAST